MQKSKNSIVLLAKKSGISSFSSLWQIKNAFETKKVGHTGTLDSFADGLLVALTGSLTRLSTYITQCDKEYLALIQFGAETDTLDPDGSIRFTSEYPRMKELLKALSVFVCKYDQQPPVFSALRVQGRRASDLIREGSEVHLKPRPVSIYSLELVDAQTIEGTYPLDKDFVHSIIIKISCSKGTYIRSLARDIANHLHVCAYVKALRRTQIGPFSLKDAAGFDELQDFNFKNFDIYTKRTEKPKKIDPQIILTKSLFLTIQYAQQLKFHTITLHPSHILDFAKGKKLQPQWFVDSLAEYPKNEEILVFSDDFLIGSIRKIATSIKYDFVVSGLL